MILNLQNLSAKLFLTDVHTHTHTLLGMERPVWFHDEPLVVNVN